MELVLFILNLTGVIVTAVVNHQYNMNNITGTLFFTLQGSILLIEIISLVIALKNSGSITEEIAVNKANKKEGESKKQALGVKRVLNYIVITIIIVGMSYLLTVAANNQVITNYQDELLNNRLLEEEADSGEFLDFDEEDEDDEDFYADANYEYIEENTTSNEVD